MPTSSRLNKLVAFIFLIIVALDQISKYWIVSNMVIGEIWEIFPFLNLVSVRNKGISFGVLYGALHPMIFVIGSLCIIAFLIVYYKDQLYYRLPLGLIVSGAVGNIIDRIVYGAVVDFVDFHISTHHWPAFNLADSAIVIGVFAMIIISYCLEENYEK
ncbi:MAG: signal peptidase II [Alphaproteobacteria bacterium]|nr:signal peptidase II [Alphaproteobacteria bacterium]